MAIERTVNHIIGYKMGKIKNVVFDLGGVIIDINRDEAVRRLIEIGVKDAEVLIDPYEQKWIFQDLETGKIGVEEFCRLLGEHIGKEIPFEDIKYAWLGFVGGVSQYKLDYILKLRESYQVYMLSNTNPIIQYEWAQTNQFTSAGRPLNDYFDKIYTSFEIGVTKPDREIFDYMIRDSGMVPEETLFVDDGERNIVIGKELGFHTYKPLNKEDWRMPLDNLLQA